MKGEKRPEKDTNRDALKLARDFYKNPNLKREDDKPTRLVDFENIAKQFKVNIRLFEPVKESKTVWKLVFGKNQFKKNLPGVDVGLFVYKTYRGFAKGDKRFVVLSPDASNVEEINDLLGICEDFFSGTNTLIILDDCAVSRDLKNRTNK